MTLTLTLIKLLLLWRDEEHQICVELWGECNLPKHRKQTQTSQIVSWFLLLKCNWHSFNSTKLSGATAPDWNQRKLESVQWIEPNSHFLLQIFWKLCNNLFYICFLTLSVSNHTSEDCSFRLNQHTQSKRYTAVFCILETFQRLVLFTPQTTWNRHL